MIVINMFSSANKVAGQGVGAVYTELMGLLKHDFANEFQINVNRYTRSDISHYHTIDPKFYLSTFSKKRGRKIGFVHFVPSTLDASLKLPRVARWTLDRYTLAFYKRMDELVVVNPNFIPKLEAYGINPDKVTYIPNFVSQRTFHPVSREKRQALRHANGFKPDDFVVFGAGQVQDRKGVGDFIKLAQQNLAHTTADYLQVKKAYEAGFTHATHFYNAMTSVHKDREYKHEGTVEGIYLMKDMTVEVVADGIHVPPAILKLVYQIKGVERTSLITDAMAAATCDNGTEHFPDSRVIIEEGVCKLADRSAIAGSIATGIRLIRTLVEKAEIPLHDAVRMASESPARLMGILDRKGTLEKGKDADIIIFNNDIEIQETFIEGKRLSKE